VLPGLTTNIPSISTFADPQVSSAQDSGQNPSKAVAYWLRRDIVRGVFAPLERLRLEHLVSFYRSGHTPVREAIVMLSSSGLAIHEYQKGYHVAPVSLEDYDDVVAVYQRLYKVALGMSIDRGDEAWEERVVVQLHRSGKVPKALPEDDPVAREKWQRAYWEFHAVILSGCGSPLLMQLLGDIGFRLERYVNLFADLESEREVDHAPDHRQIADAVVARDAPRATKLIEAYFASAQPIRDSIIARLRDEQPASRRAARSRASAA